MPISQPAGFIVGETDKDNDPTTPKRSIMGNASKILEKKEMPADFLVCISVP